MALPKHLEEAVARHKEAALRIGEVRSKPLTLENSQEWLVALTDLSLAMSDIHEFNKESVHEKLHDLASRLGLRRFPSAGPQGT